MIFLFPLSTYWNVNGLLKKTNDMIIVTAFLHVVTVTAAKAPHVLTRVRTICIPKYPVKEKINEYPYIFLGFCKINCNFITKFSSIYRGKKL